MTELVASRGHVDPRAQAPLDARGSSPEVPLIDVRSVTKRYEGFTLDAVDLRVEPGQVVGFIGQNGAGKSTTIKALLGLIGLDGGEARALGVSARVLAGSAAADVREQVGVVFDTVSVPPNLRVTEVGALMASAYTTWDADVFAQLLGRFELDSTKLVKDLSRGMGMKLSLACALAHRPRVLILDEATAGLDPMARDEVLDLLRDFVAVEDGAGNLRNGILMSSHITSDLEKIADEIVCIDAGRIVFRCTKDEITDLMGVARCRMADLERLAREGGDVLVPAQEGSLGARTSAGVVGAAASGARISGAPRAGAATAATAGRSGAASARGARGIRYVRHDYGADVLVPDRFAFAEMFPEIPCDRMCIDDYMTLMLKGELFAAGPVASKGGE